MHTERTRTHRDDNDRRLAARSFWPTATVGLLLLAAVSLAPAVVERARLADEADRQDAHIAALRVEGERLTADASRLRDSLAMPETRVSGFAMPLAGVIGVSPGPIDPRPHVAWLSPLAADGPPRTWTALCGATLLVMAWVWLTPERVGRVRAAYLAARRAVAWR